MTRDELIDLAANTMVKTDAFLAAHGKEWVVSTLANDPEVTVQALIDTINDQRDLVEKYNPDWDGNLEERSADDRT